MSTRRSIRQFRPQAVDGDSIQRLLVAAVQAPNPRRTQPWRFFVVDSEGPVRSGLRDLAREVALCRAIQVDEGAAARAEVKAREMTETPVILFVYAVPGRDPMETQANYSPVRCPIQNILLATSQARLA